MWKSKIEAECGDIAMALVQNKVDLLDRACASPEEVNPQPGDHCLRHGVEGFRVWGEAPLFTLNPKAVTHPALCPFFAALSLFGGLGRDVGV